MNRPAKLPARDVLMAWGLLPCDVAGCDVLVNPAVLTDDDEGLCRRCRERRRGRERAERARREGRRR